MWKDNVIAVLCSDIHLSHKPPVARSAEESWYEAMARPLREMRQVASDLNVPIVCAGDIFDRWNSCPEIINFAIKELPPMFAIPGQHDLPNHSIQEMERSAYWTLVEAKVIKMFFILIKDGKKWPNWHCNATDELRLHLFPWESEVQPLKETIDLFHLAVIHEYCWTWEFCYPGAPKEQRLSARKQQLSGYNAIVYGDNHKGFVKGNVCNCGTLMRRSIDEINYKPFIGLLHRDGTIEQHFLDTSQDKFLEVDEVKLQETHDITEFIEELKTLGPDSLDFRTAVEQYIEGRKIEAEVKTQIIQILDEEQK